MKAERRPKVDASGQGAIVEESGQAHEILEPAEPRRLIPRTHFYFIYDVA
jgi:hypothetical protein